MKKVTLISRYVCCPLFSWAPFMDRDVLSIKELDFHHELENKKRDTKVLGQAIHRIRKINFQTRKKRKAGIPRSCERELKVSLRTKNKKY